MPYIKDFELRIESRATYVPHHELLPEMHRYLVGRGISSPEDYDHYQIGVIVEPRFPRGGQPNVILRFLREYSLLPRKRRRRTFAAVDSVFLIFTTQDDSIEIREAFPPTTLADGNMELELGGDVDAKLGVGMESPLSKASVTAKLHSHFKRIFKSEKFAIVRQHSSHYVIWDFRKAWFLAGQQPAAYFTCSIPKTLDPAKRILHCQRHITADGGRVISAPKKVTTITLPRPSH